MDLTHHHLDSLTDDSWIKYISKMGEDALYEYKNKVYKFLYNLKVGESISIEKWVETENYDLFIKIACCFMSEQKGSYYFYNHTRIRSRNRKLATKTGNIAQIRNICNPMIHYSFVKASRSRKENLPLIRVCTTIFTPTAVLCATHAWQLYRGEKKMTEREYVALVKHLQISHKEALDVRQLDIINTTHRKFSTLNRLIGVIGDFDLTQRKLDSVKRALEVNPEKQIFKCFKWTDWGKTASVL